MQELTNNEILNITNFYTKNGNVDIEKELVKQIKSNPEFKEHTEALKNLKIRLNYINTLESNDETKKQRFDLLESITEHETALKPFQTELNEIELKISTIAPFELDTVLKSRIDGYGALLLRNIKASKRAIKIDGSNIAYKGLKLKGLNDNQIKAIAFILGVDVDSDCYDLKNGFKSIEQRLKSQNKAGAE